MYFLTHPIRISEIVPWDSKSYFGHAILPRLSREGYTHWLYWKSRTWSSSDVIVLLKWRHHVKLHLSESGTSGNLSKTQKQWGARKIIHYLCEGRIENPPLRITVCHHSASLVMPKGDPQNIFFYPTLTLMMDSYNKQNDKHWWSCSDVFDTSQRFGSTEFFNT